MCALTLAMVEASDLAGALNMVPLAWGHRRMVDGAGDQLGERQRQGDTGAPSPRNSMQIGINDNLDNKLRSIDQFIHNS
jgi:hypothetical protein